MLPEFVEMYDESTALQTRDSSDVNIHAAWGSPHWSMNSYVIYFQVIYDLIEFTNILVILVTMKEEDSLVIMPPKSL